MRGPVCVFLASLTPSSLKAPEWPSELGETVADGTARWAAVKAHTWLTRAGHNQVESMRTWQWTEILQVRLEARKVL